MVAENSNDACINEGRRLGWGGARVGTGVMDAVTGGFHILANMLNISKRFDASGVDHVL